MKMGQPAHIVCAVHQCCLWSRIKRASVYEIFSRFQKLQNMKRQDEQAGDTLYNTILQQLLFMEIR